MDGGRDWAAEVGVLCEMMNTYYLYPDVAARMNQVLAERLAEGAYRRALDEPAFAEAVTRDTVAASGDLHLRLRYSKVALPESDDPVVPDSGRDPYEAALTGHGFAKVERLLGNMGLVDIRRFWPLSISRHAAVAAMHLVAHTDVLIIDLRHSLGGEPEMVSFLCSFLFDQRVHLNDLYFPRHETTIEWWTDPSVPRPTFGGIKPIYVLVSNRTISAAEEFCYDLQQQGRAVVIGETTAGAGNFDYRYRVNEHLMFSVPSGYPVNPVSRKGWEGTGVQPDVALDPERAFTHAYRLALDHVIDLGSAGHRSVVHREATKALEDLRPTS